MAQRLVLSVDDDLTVTNLRQFMKRIDEIGISGPTKLKYTEDEGTHMLTAPVPDGVVPRRRVVRRKVTKKETQIKEAATEQIKQHKKAIKDGEAVPGHVAPVKGVKKTKRKRAKKSAPPKEEKAT